MHVFFFHFSPPPPPPPPPLLPSYQSTLVHPLGARGVRVTSQNLRWGCDASFFKPLTIFTPNCAIFSSQFQTWPLKISPFSSQNGKNLYPISGQAGKTFPIWNQSVQNLYPFSDQNFSKTRQQGSLRAGSHLGSILRKQWARTWFLQLSPLGLQCKWASSQARYVAAHTYIAYIGEYPHPRALPSPSARASRSPTASGTNFA